MRKTVIKSLKIFALILVLAFAALALWLKFFFPAEEFRKLAEARISKSLGRDCRIESLDISILHGFAVDLKGLWVAARNAETCPFLLRAEHLYLKVRLWPLLRRRVEVASLSISRPELYLEKDEKGHLTLSRKTQEGELKEGAEAPEAGARDFSLYLPAVALEKATVHYLDQKENFDLTFSPLSARFFLLESGPARELKITGQAELAGLSSKSLEAFSALAPALPLKADFSAALDSAWNSLSLESLKLKLAGMELEGSGSLKDLQQESSVYSLRLKGGTDRPDGLLRLLPPAVDSLLALKELKGGLGLEAVVQGRTGSAEGPAYRVMVSLNKMRVSFGAFPRPVTGLEARLSLDKAGLAIESFSAGLGPDPLLVSGRIGLEEGYPARLELKAGLTLDDLPRMLPSLAGWKTEGALEADLRLDGKLEALTSLQAFGSVKGRGLVLAGPAPAVPLELPRVELVLAGPDVEKVALELAAGRSSLSLEGSVRNFRWLLLWEKDQKGPPASWNLEVRGTRLDIQDFYPPDSTVKAGQGAGKTGETASLSLPFSLGRGAGRLQIEKLVLAPRVSLDEVDVSFTVSDKLLSLDRIGAGLFSGRLSGSGRADLSGEAAGTAYVLDVATSEVKAGELLTPFSSLGSHLSGAVAAKLHLEGSGAGLDLIAKSLAGTAEFELAGGKLTGWPVLNGLAGLTQIGELKELPLDDWLGKLAIRDERIFGADLALRAAGNDLLVSGSSGFDGSLDYALELTLSDALSRKYSALLPGEFTRLLRGGQEERLTLNFKIGGTTGAPKITWDTQPLERRAMENLRRSLSRQLDKLTDKLFPSSAPKGDSLATDSAGAKPVPADSLAGPGADEAIKEAQKLLKNLFKKKKQPNP